MLNLNRRAFLEAVGQRFYLYVAHPGAIRGLTNTINRG